MIGAFAFAARSANADFKSSQKSAPRVGEAYRLKETSVKHIFSRAGVAWPPSDLYFRAFKEEKGHSPGVVEMWARAGTDKRFQLVKTYPICAFSGVLGPKRRGGDGQVPEGFYEISGFNPASSFLLSLRISYPNRADRIRAGRANPGGDIFMHGNCVTIGCIPMGDDAIREIYVAAIEARNHNGRLPFHIFPLRMDDSGMKRLRAAAGSDTELMEFWNNLHEGYLLFERTGTPPSVTIATNGRYGFKSN
jgi:murein L,D-transpeptidase YafK